MSLIKTLSHNRILNFFDCRDGAGSIISSEGSAVWTATAPLGTGTENALELRGVGKYFGALAALDDINISVRPGERRAVLGSNGARDLNCHRLFLEQAMSKESTPNRLRNLENII